MYFSVFKAFKRYKPYFKETSFTSHALYEAVLFPTDYKYELEKKLKDFFNKNLKRDLKLSMLCARLTFLLRGYKIKVKEWKSTCADAEECNFYGIENSGTFPDKNGSIIIYLNTRTISIFTNELFYRKFYDFFIIQLEHEIVHRKQFLTVKDIKLRKKLFTKKDPLSPKRYLSDKQEVMARAWDIIETLRCKGKTYSDILQIIQSPKKYKEDIKIHSLVAYYFYFSNRNREDQEVLNQLKKYIYEYIEQREK